MPFVSKQEADAHDRIMDAASDLLDLMTDSGIDIPEEELEELSIFLVRNGPAVREILKPVKRTWGPAHPGEAPG